MRLRFCAGASFNKARLMMRDFEQIIRARTFGRLAIAQLDRDMDELVVQVIKHNPGLSRSDYLRAVIRTDFLESIAEDLGIKDGLRGRVN